ncbi:MAG: hypothetical protein ACRDZY_19960, partial [Acidimicrobiales bacterium]
VERLEDDPPSAAVGEAVTRVERLVRRALALSTELDEGPTVPSNVELVTDPEVSLWQLCAISPIGQLDRQKLLEASTVEERIARLEEATSGAYDALAARLAGA